MHTHRSSRSFLAITAVSAMVLSSLSAVPLFAQSGETVTDNPVPPGFLQIDQETTAGLVMPWSLLNTNHETFTGAMQTQQIQVPPGGYTFFTEQPQGYKTIITLYDGATVLASAESPQITFQFAGTTGLRLNIKFTINLFGSVNVLSDPSGVPFELRGPNNAMIKDTTPQSYFAMPIGLYSVRYFPEGCAVTPPRSDELKKESRIDFMVNIKCDTLKTVEVQEAIDKGYVSTTVEGAFVVYHDVPVTAWFAPHVSGVARRAILSGYKNEDGTPSDRFGPENLVTLAELAKIMHELAGLNEREASITPRNLTATGWSYQYIASAEERDWVVFSDPTVDLQRPAKRAEVVETLLQALDIPLRWPKGTLFTDVRRRTQYAAAIETAANDGIVAGRTGTGGVLTGEFAPYDSINRAEISKIVIEAIEKYRLEEPSSAASSSQR